MTTSVSTQEAVNPLMRLNAFGQSPWLDYIRRDLMQTGELQRLIDEDGLRGMTSNPSIFEKAVAAGGHYDDILSAASDGDSAKTVYERLAVRDVQDAADILRPVYDQTEARDGYVSLEVAPTLANDTQATQEEARRLWASVNRPNLMIKVPGTEQGIPAIRALTSEGINVNVTLLFARGMYTRAAQAFISGLQDRHEAGQPVSGIASVASFFVSRIDSKVDAALQAKIDAAPDQADTLRPLLGQAAIANAKLAYELYEELFSGPAWQALEAQGAQTQRLLWASTSTKNPAYRDVVYVEQLIGPDTVNTIPPATWDAFRDHGVAAETLTTGVDEARAALDALAAAGIDLDSITAELEVEGVAAFKDSFVKLLAAVGTRA